MAVDRFLELAPPPRPLSEGETYNVFISYRSLNRPWVINLYDALNRAGHSVFLDQRVLVPGQPLQRSIEDALERSQSGVLVWSKESAESKWVREEYDVLRGRMRDEPDSFFFVPVRLDNAPLPAFARTQNYLNFSQYPDGPNGGELLRLLHGIVGKPLSEEALKFAEQLDAQASSAMIEIRAAVKNRDPEHLLELFDTGSLAWDVSSALGSKAIEQLAALGKHSEAIGRAGKLVEKFPSAVRPKQMLAHVLTRSGSEENIRKARRILGNLYEGGENDPETLGLYARTFMDLYKQKGQRSDLKQSRDLYEEGFLLSRDNAYCGNNAAAKSVFLGEAEDLEKAKIIATDVLALLPDEITPGMDYWDAATIAEQQLISGDIDKAVGSYRKAVDLAPNVHGSHRSTYDQLKLLLEHLPVSQEQKKAFHAVFSHLEPT